MRQCFTLAEILITLSIIGVIASITIPSLVQDVQEAEWKAGYKKAFADAAQVWFLMLSEKSIVPRSGWHDLTANRTNFDTFKSKFRIIKDCTNNNNSECWPPGGELFFSGPMTHNYAFIDNAGRVWSHHHDDGTMCLDTNGKKGPNKYGRDRFVLSMNTTTSSTPVQLLPWSDQVSADSSSCPSGGCYYRSWLKE